MNGLVEPDFIKDIIEDLKKCEPLKNYLVAGMHSAWETTQPRMLPSSFPIAVEMPPNQGAPVLHNRLFVAALASLSSAAIASGKPLEMATSEPKKGKSASNAPPPIGRTERRRLERAAKKRERKEQKR